MNKKNKRITLFLLLLNSLLIIAIASGISNLSLKPGMPLPVIENNRIIINTENKKRESSISLYIFLIFISILFLIFIFILVIYKITKLSQWKTILSVILSVFLVSIGILAVSYLILHSIRNPAEGNRIIINNAETKKNFRVPLEAVPENLTLIVAFVFAGLVILSGLKIFISGSKSKKVMHPAGLEAELAMKAIIEGRDFKDIITRCYRQMSTIAEKESGSGHDKSKTTREIEFMLEKAGVPRNSVQVLTRLFEAVRYGSFQPGKNDEQNAIGCFKDIVQYFRKETGN